jgi:hypothetical protein
VLVQVGVTDAEWRKAVSWRCPRWTIARRAVERAVIDGRAHGFAREILQAGRVGANVNALRSSFVAGFSRNIHGGGGEIKSGGLCRRYDLVDSILPLSDWQTFGRLNICDCNEDKNIGSHWPQHMQQRGQPLRP